MKKVVFLSVFAALCPLVAAHAVVLEQRWTPGQDLNYQTALRGTMNVQAPASANFILAGVPVDVEIRGDGVAQFKTLSVDSAGIGTIAVRVPQFDLQGETWGQRGQLTLGETSSKFSINGKPYKLGDGTNPINKSQSALRISRQGRVIGLQNLAPKAAPPKQDAPVANPADAINRGALMTAAIFQALPTLWPGRDIQVGESWQTQVIFPVASPADPKKVTPTQFGEWNLTLKGEETIGGKPLQRVAVKGSLSVDSAQFAVPTAKAPRGVAKQEISGDLWLDAAAGQIARANLVVGARVEGAKGTKDQSHADFTGTLQLNLKNAA
jgi:hypothetical protein